MRRRTSFRRAPRPLELVPAVARSTTASDRVEDGGRVVLDGHKAKTVTDRHYTAMSPSMGRIRAERSTTHTL
jgi:hypothetical protein